MRAGRCGAKGRRGAERDEDGKETGQVLILGRWGRGGGNRVASEGLEEFGESAEP